MVFIVVYLQPFLAWFCAKKQKQKTMEDQHFSRWCKRHKLNVLKSHIAFFKLYLSKTGKYVKVVFYEIYFSHTKCCSRVTMGSFVLVCSECEPSSRLAEISKEIS